MNKENFLSFGKLVLAAALGVVLADFAKTVMAKAQTSKPMVAKPE